MEEWATNTMKHNPWWRDNMKPDEYDKEREYYFKNFDSLVKNGKYTPLWKEYVEDYEDKNGKSVEMDTILDFVADINSEMEAPVIAKMKTFD